MIRRIFSGKQPSGLFPFFLLRTAVPGSSAERTAVCFCRCLFYEMKFFFKIQKKDLENKRIEAILYKKTIFCSIYYTAV